MNSALKHILLVIFLATTIVGNSQCTISDFLFKEDLTKNEVLKFLQSNSEISDVQVTMDVWDKPEELNGDSVLYWKVGYSFKDHNCVSAKTHMQVSIMKMNFSLAGVWKQNII